MFLLKYLSFIPFVTALFAFGAGPSSPSSNKAKLVRWAVLNESTLTIAGKSNINTFGCDVVRYNKPDTILCSPEDPVSKLVTLRGSLEISINKFDCHNKILTNDLRKTLKADNYPTLTVKFLSLERSPMAQSAQDYFRGWVEIELAGTTRRFEINYTFQQNNSAYIQLNGKRTFSFSDFKLTAPRKLGGMIKVEDNFNVDFRLILSPVS
jgi:hypothetical protein